MKGTLLWCAALVVAWSLSRAEIVYHWNREGLPGTQQAALKVTTDTKDVIVDNKLDVGFFNGSSHKNGPGGSGRAEDNDEWCGVSMVRKRIVNGEYARPGQIPWAVPLLVSVNIRLPNSTDTVPGVRICGASIIGRKWLISASHCFIDMNKCMPDGQYAFTLPGDITLDLSDSSLQNRAVLISKVYIRRDYNCANDQHDIVLIRLAKEIEFDRNKLPLCLPTPWQQFPPGSECRVAGWGKRGENKSISYFLKYTPITVQNRNDCQYLYANLDVPTVICAGGYTRDSCQGDSGGPLFCKKDNRWVQAGVVSLGPKRCATLGFPAIYTAVSPYVNWIKRIIEAEKIGN